MLKKYLEENRISKRAFCLKIQISRPTMDNILNKTAKDISYKVATKIYEETGFKPWDYLNGYKAIKKLVK